MMRLRETSMKVMMLIALVTLGCGVTGNLPQGQENGPCRADGTCDEGLTCASGVCVRLGSETDGADGNRGDGGGPGRDAAAVLDAGTLPDAGTDGAIADAGIDGGLPFKVCADPVAVDFGTVVVGQKAQQTITFRACGDDPVLVLSVGLAGSSGDWFAIEQMSATLPAVINPETAMTVVVGCRPHSAGTQRGQLDIQTGDPSLPDGKGFIRLTCAGNELPACKIKADPAGLNFGKMLSNATATLDFFLSNVGDTPCDVTGISGPSNPEFTIAAITDDQGGAIGGAPFPIAAAGRVGVSVRFAAPSAKVCLVDKITFANTSANAPNLDVSLAGCGGETPICKFKVQPLGTLNFGNVAKGVTKAMGVDLENTGTATCQVTEAKFGTQTGPWFTFAKAYTFPIEVQPGASTRIEVSCAPTTTGAAPTATGIPDIYGLNVLNTSTTDPAQPANGGSSACASAGWCHKLLCTGVNSRLDVLPNPVDFGMVSLGCNSREVVATLYNNGTSEFGVSRIEIGPGVNPSFSIVSSALPVPFTIGAHASVEVRLKYHPSVKGVESGVFRIHTDAPNAVNGTVDIPMFGEGTGESDVKDLFVQTDKPMVDVLWCVDNSGSMGEEQTGLASNFPQFIDYATSLNIDYQMGVVTSEINEAERLSTGMNYPGVLFQRQGNPRILTNSDPHPTTPPYQPTNVDVVNAFQANAMPGECCSDEAEACMEAVRMALSPPLIDDEQANKGFLRRYAKLVVIMMSDEEDQSPGAVDYYVEFLKSLKGAKNKDLLSVSIIAGIDRDGDAQNPPNAQACSTADAGVRYVDLFKKIGNGLAVTICNNNWGQTMQALGLDAFVSVIEYFLSRQADPSSIAVKVNGAAVPNDPIAGYTYDPNTNSIVFGSAAVPPKGAQIEVTYSAQCY